MMPRITARRSNSATTSAPTAVDDWGDQQSLREASAASLARIDFQGPTAPNVVIQFLMSSASNTLLLLVSRFVIGGCPKGIWGGGLLSSF